MKNKYDVVKDEFKNFATNLTIEDIDFDNKIENLIGSGELNNIICDDVYKMKKDVYKYIKEHINEYEDDIIEETIRIKEQYKSTDSFELTAGLYNMDNFYLKAIKHVICNPRRICLDTPLGTLSADYEKREEVGYDAIYISITPKNTDEIIDLARIKVNKNNRLELQALFNQIQPTTYRSGV